MRRFRDAAEEQYEDTVNSTDAILMLHSYVVSLRVEVLPRTKHQACKKSNPYIQVIYSECLLICRNSVMLKRLISVDVG